MKSKLLYEKSKNKCPPCRNKTQPCTRRFISRLNRTCCSFSTETLDLLTCDSRKKYKFLFVYKVASISVCDTSCRFSEVRHFI